MSGIEQNIVKQAKRFNQPIPDRIKNKPDLLAGLSLYLDAFFDLLNDANSSGFIPWTAIVSYATYHCFSKEQTDLAIYFIRELNGAYLKHTSKQKGR